MAIDRQEFLEFALALADAAQTQILPYYQTAWSAINQMVQKLLMQTVMPRKSSGRRLASGIRAMGFWARNMGKYHPYLRNRQSTRWIIDPLDGTTWFTLGMPLFGTLIALLEDGDPTVGVIHFPVIGETVYAGRGLGCWFRRNRESAEEPRQLWVSDGGRLENAFLSASGVHGTDIHSAADGPCFDLTSIMRRARKFRFCGDCMQHALVCRSMIHAAIDTIMQPWDIAAIVPCIEEAGGIVTSLTGERENIVFSGSLLSSCDAALHEEVLDILQATQ